jgi:hypothetical protein
VSYKIASRPASPEIHWFIHKSIIVVRRAHERSWSDVSTDSEPDEPSSHPQHSIYFTYILTLFSHLRLDVPSDILSSPARTKFFYIFLVLLMAVTTKLYVIIPIMFLFT